jgi:hypothetical protein
MHAISYKYSLYFSVVRMISGMIGRFAGEESFREAERGVWRMSHHAEQ